MSVSPRTLLELVSAAALAGLLIWQFLTAAGLRTAVARLETKVQADQLVIQAKDVTAKSCQFALTRAGEATAALGRATVSAYASSDLALQAAQDRAPATAAAVTRLLSVRAAPGQDCQIATGLARSAWEEGQ